MHIEWTMRKTGTILGSEIRGMRRRTRDDRVKQRISGKEMEKEKKKEKRRTDSKKETIKYEERERERRRTPFLPSMPLLDHVKYANCGYAEALLVLVLPSTNYISFGRMCVARAMGTHRIPRVYAPCPKTVHTVKYTRAPTFLSRSWTSSFPPSTPDPPPFVALVAILPRLTRDARPNLSPRIYTRVEWHAIGNFCPPLLVFFPPPIRELWNRSGDRLAQKPVSTYFPHSSSASARPPFDQAVPLSKISWLPVNG